MKTSKIATEADRSIGSRIAALRVANGLSQTALGEALGISFQQVQKYEKGLNRIGAGRLQITADILQVPITAFFTSQVKPVSKLGTKGRSFNDPQVEELVKIFTHNTDQEMRKTILSLLKTAVRLQYRRSRQADYIRMNEF
ncbi:helix-turn-helix transcriptional regulator [Methylobacterium sp. WL6]|uniref:helix-turn-helix domain-containing protein n=1 Tax=Methylobacterium sp. WL6 TaxID=2603901 RepID=UPI0011C9A44D|nr:helix-turn-helix transcriptional regulator [Methylobacterium sp. WL6]TXN62781.1 helix-turn-helix transcriptional regulator [Methylobacterium sp. WL6]